MTPNPNPKAAVAIVAPFLALLALSSAGARDVSSGAITIETPWSRATPGGAKIAIGYLTIRNAGDLPDRLVSSASPLSARAMAHTMTTTGGVMEMRPLPGGLVVPPHGAVILKPGSDHIMFEDIGHPLRKGDRLAATLTFEKAGAIPVEFTVEGVGAQAPDAMKMDME